MEGTLQHVLGQNVRAIRAARQQSQEELADSLGVHRTYVGGLERGERNLTLRTVERLANLLGTDPVGLLIPPEPALRAAHDGTAPADARRAPGRRPRPQPS